MSLTVGSLFSGIGGFDLGLERAGMWVEWQCEYDEKCRELLGQRWPMATIYDDVRTVTDAPAVDVLCGGFPCQDLSVAGNRAGLAGERSGLFHQFMRLADELSPRWVLIENVPGLLTSNEGRDMGVVLGTLADLGYGWVYRVLDAQYFGVAQRRRRVFIVGCLGDSARAAAVLLEPESCDGDSAPQRGPWPTDTGRVAGGASGVGVAAPLLTHTVNGGMRSTDIDGATWVVEPLLAYGVHENDRSETRLSPELAFSLSTGGGKPGQGYPAVQQGMAVRRLTPMECERLQGFPDGWTEGFADSTRYRMLGNAVCVPVAEWIGRRIIEAAA